MQFKNNAPTPPADTFQVTFETANAAFYEEPDYDETPPRDFKEAARILRELAAKIEDGQTSGQILDANGHNVGGWAWN